MTEIDWSLGTFEGVRADQARRMATTTPDERLAWLEDVLRLALGSGALERVRQQRQREVESAWYGDPGTRT